MRRPHAPILVGFSTTVSDKWLLIGDFNLILDASNKSNANLNRRLMCAFRDAIQELELRELNLRGRKITWSNDSTQIRIDRAFCTAEWDIMMPGCMLQVLSSLVSDHAPLLLSGTCAVQSYRGIKFETFWPRLQGFSQVVGQAWQRPLALQNPFLRLHTKLQRTGKKLKDWAKSKIGNIKLLMYAARQLIGILDVVQEFRQLSEEEIQLKRDLKIRFLGMAAVEKLRCKQASRLTSIRAAEANSKLFYLQAKGRKRKNFISELQEDDRILRSHGVKEGCLLNHFNRPFGSPPVRVETLNWEALGLPHVNLEHLEEEFSEEEIQAAVKELKSDKAPGPDGFIGLFYKSCWGIIKEDLKAAINFFYAQHDQHFKHLNTAHVVLIPKKCDALNVGDYRPISLTHSVAKLISKLLANRLAACLNQLVSRAQSAFIKRRSIHDNFMYTQNLIKELHRAKYPALFLKLDIAKAFDSVRWDYLLEVLT